MKKFIIITAVIFLAITINAQDFLYKKTGKFDKIEVFGSIEITLIKGNADSVKLMGDNEILGKVSVEVENGLLTISATDRIFSKHKNVTATVYYIKLDNLKTRSGAEINSTKAIQSDTLAIEAAGGSRVDIKAECKSIKTNAVEGATISLEGKANNLNCETTTGGIFVGFEFKCDSIIAKTSTGGLAKIYPVNMLDASASMGGQVIYRGNPAKKKEHTILGGTIENTAE
jgi:hypothetical protein